MPLRIESDVNAEDLCTLATPAIIKQFVQVHSDAELEEAVRLAKQKRLRIFPIGDGSNILFGVDRFEALAIHYEPERIEILESSATHTDVRVEAGRNWDEFVQWAIKRDLAGIESMSIVPGTMGSVPVQNVGCYGQEVSETITAVRAFDMKKQKWVEISNQDCQFTYRDSLFKHPAGKHYFITAVTFRLIPGTRAPTPEYVTLQEELAKRGIEGKPTLKQIRSALITVRTNRLPDPKKIPTAGSFFHNPIVSAEKYQALAKKYPELPHYPAAGGKVKLSAPWLVEACGLKGFERDGIGLYKKQAIALINPGHRPGKELLKFRDYVAGKVFKKFGVRLNMEPELVK